MELGDPIDPLGLRRPDPVDAGWVRRIRSEPLTIDQALARGLAAMLDEDDEERRQCDPLAYVRAQRQRRNVLSRLLRR
jgi:hypothetical protein